jgi:hypothetical protein
LIIWVSSLRVNRNIIVLHSNTSGVGSKGKVEQIAPYGIYHAEKKAVASDFAHLELFTALRPSVGNEEPFELRKGYLF